MAVVETVPSGLTTKYGGGAHQWNVQLKNFFRMLYVNSFTALQLESRLTPALVD